MKHYRVLLLWLCSPFFGYGQDGFIQEIPRLAYWQIGHREEIVIVLHGGPGAPHQYLRPEFDALTETARVIYYDQRGCGKSDISNSYIWQEHVNDLKRLISTLAKGQKVFLAGSSWGSILAILYAYTHPKDVKGLVLSGTLPWNGEEGVYKRDYYSSPNIQRFPMIEKRLVRHPTIGGGIKIDTIEVAKEVAIYLGMPQTEPFVSRITAPRAERLKQIRIPILLFHGTYNRELDWANEYAKLFPNIQVHKLEETGHDSWFGDPISFFSITNEFIKNNGK
jgi:pimeloyl-ACP methyl ester carboxylesterase